jgi:hypothetical protein
MNRYDSYENLGLHTVKSNAERPRPMFGGLILHSLQLDPDFGQPRGLASFEHTFLFNISSDANLAFPGMFSALSTTLSQILFVDDASNGTAGGENAIGSEARALPQLVESGTLKREIRNSILPPFVVWGLAFSMTPFAAWIVQEREEGLKFSLLVSGLSLPLFRFC